MIRLKECSQALFVGLLWLSTNLYAETQPKFSILPTTPTKAAAAIGETISVTYRITNNTKATRQLTMVAIAGVKQVAGISGRRSL
ncbi:MAG: hypothetical protein PSV35_04355 [bacterium]|nr:hypothetical protein [bacterium]